MQAALLPAAAGRITVHREAQVTVGSASHRAGTVLPALRLAAAVVASSPAATRRGAAAQGYTLLTDRWDLTADEVVRAYLWRWRIELFFRLLKSHLHLDRPLGGSRNAVALTFWLALLAQLLIGLLVQALGRKQRSPELLALLASSLAALQGVAAAAAVPPGQQLAWGTVDCDPPPGTIVYDGIEFGLSPPSPPKTDMRRYGVDGSGVILTIPPSAEYAQAPWPGASEATAR